MTSLPLPFAVIAVFLLALALLLAAYAGRSRKAWQGHIQAKRLMTANETEFFYRLQRALPALHVFPQVSFAAFITDDNRLSRKARWSVRARFDRKIADFLICDRESLRVLAVVELDDRTHNAHADRQRDAISKAAGVQTIRFQSKQKPTEAEIAALFQHARAWIKV
jgi:hypothetical protein